ncbi:MAG: hypothetical protein JXN60_07845, partial [Lentisphaerae bacterium]|nr:hypothetical protein [Lentisphaerota bacterium]
MRKIRYLIEYITMRMGLFLLDSVSISTSIRIAHIFADFWYTINTARRRIAIRNILQSKITNDPREAATIARKSFRHFGAVIVESLKSSEFFNEENWRDKV